MSRNSELNWLPENVVCFVFMTIWSVRNPKESLHLYLTVHEKVDETLVMCEPVKDSSSFRVFVPNL